MDEGKNMIIHGKHKVISEEISSGRWMTDTADFRELVEVGTVRVARV